MSSIAIASLLGLASGVALYFLIVLLASMVGRSKGARR
jgi:hypothetical protein